MKLPFPEDHGLWPAPDELVAEAQFVDEANDVPVGAEDVVVELLEPRRSRAIAHAEARGEAAGDWLALDDGDRMPALRQPQRHGEAKGSAPENGIAGGHGGYSAGSVTALARRFATPLGAAIALVVALMAVTLIVAVTPVGARWNGDLQLFHHYAGTFLDGYVSRTSFLSWYPPLTLLPLTLPRLVAADLPTYTFLFALEMSLAAGVLVLITAQIASRWPGRAKTAVSVILALLLLSAIYLPWRFDILPAALTAGATLAVLSRRPAVAGVLLGIGASLKLYPAVLVPAVLLWLWYRHERAAALRARAGLRCHIRHRVWALSSVSSGESRRPPPIPGRSRAPDRVTASHGNRPVAWAGAIPRPGVGGVLGWLTATSVGAAANVGLRTSTGLEALFLVGAVVSVWWSFGRRQPHRGLVPQDWHWRRRSCCWP